MEHFVLIELVAFFGLALGIGLWQYFKMDRELKRDRAAREAREAETSRGEDA